MQADTASEEVVRSTVPVDTAKVYGVSEVDYVPSLPGGGGERGIVAAIQRGFRYPVLALRKGAEGTVKVSFTVNEQGHPTTINVLQGPGYGINEEVIRVINTLPAFIPGKLQGHAVKVYFTLPVAVQIR